MQDYMIYTDSTADLSPQIIETLGVKVIPFEFTMDGKTYFDYPDGRELSPKDFYTLLREGKMGTTSLVNTERYMGIFEPDLKAGKDILYIAFSSGLTGSVACAMAAAEELRMRYPERTILVVDSLAASMGQGLLCYLAVEQQRAGLDIHALAAFVEQKRDFIAHWVTVDDLDHLHRGGRVSAAQAIVGGMLGIKPMLHIDDEGHLVPVDKVRGRRAALDALVGHITSNGVDLKNATIMISHADSLEDCKYVETQIRKKLGVKEVFINTIGPVIGAHAGPGTIALFYVASGKN